MLLLNLGSGPHVAEGWTAIDASWNAWLAGRPAVRRVARAVGLVAAEHERVGWPEKGILCHDVRQGLPYADGAVDGIFAAHFLEHLSPAEARALLAECHRVLAPRAPLRIIVPDLETMVGCYAAGLASHDPEVRAKAAGRFLDSLNLEGFRAWPPGIAWSVARRVSRAGHRALYDRHALVGALADAGFPDAAARKPLESRLPALERVERPELHEFSICVEAAKP